MLPLVRPARPALGKKAEAAARYRGKKMTPRQGGQTDYESKVKQNPKIDLTKERNNVDLLGSNTFVHVSRSGRRRFGSLLGLMFRVLEDEHDKTEGLSSRVIL